MMSSHSASPRLPRNHKREAAYTDWNDAGRYYTPRLGDKYYTSPNEYSYDTGSIQLKSSKKTDSVTADRVKEPKSVKDVFSRFADTTSLHTMPFLNRASRWYAKALWVILFLAATGVWLFHSVYLIKTYMALETSSSVKIVYETIDFPSITFCNINPIRTTQVRSWGTQELNNYLAAINPRQEYDNSGENSGEVATTMPPVPTGDMTGSDQTTPSGLPPPSGKKRRKRDVSAEEPRELYDYSLYVDQADFDPLDSVNWTHYVDNVAENGALLESQEVTDYSKTVTVFQELLVQNRNYNRTQMGHELTTMMLSCSYDGKICNAKNFSRWLDINYGNCWTFNSGELLTKPTTSAKSGSNYGLDMILYIQDYEYVGGLQLGRGIRMVAHPFKTLPLVQDNGISVAPGQQTYMGLRVLNQTRLGGGYGACDDDNGTYVAYFNNTYDYTIEGCINTCLDRTIANECGCFRRTKRQYYNSVDVKSLRHCKTQEESQCVQDRVDGFEAGSINCSCNQACHTVEYETMSSFDLWPDESLWFSLVDAVCQRTGQEECEMFKDVDSDDRLDFLRKNFLHLKVYYRDLNVQFIEEKAAYEFIQFGSDLGGAVGLWIGASIISIFEIFELSCQLCNFCARKRKYNERKAKQKGNQATVPSSRRSPSTSHRDFIHAEEGYSQYGRKSNTLEVPGYQNHRGGRI